MLSITETSSEKGGDIFILYLYFLSDFSFFLLFDFDFVFNNRWLKLQCSDSTVLVAKYV